MTDLNALALRVEQLDGADREVDALIHEAVTTFPPRRAGVGWPDENALVVPVFPGWALLPKYSASLDAVCTLIDPADEWELTTLYNIARAVVGLNRDHHTSWPGHGEHQGADPVLALLSASLKARSKSHD